jgi:hypothetical protein
MAFQGLRFWDQARCLDISVGTSQLSQPTEATLLQLANIKLNLSKMDKSQSRKTPKPGNTKIFRY